MIGDVLTSTILFEAIKKKYPKAKIDYLINEHTFPVVENNPYIDNFIRINTSDEKNKLFKLIKQIRKNKYDVIIDVYGKIGTFLICLFSSSKIKSSYYKNYTFFAYTHTLKRIKKPSSNMSLAIENRLLLLRPIGISANKILPKIHLKTSELIKAKNYLMSNDINLNKPLFMISVLGSSLIKSYPFDYMAVLLNSINKDNPESQIIFNYIPNQINDVEKIYGKCNKETQNSINLNVYGKNLREFLAICKHCNALIGNEGGANNMSKALDIPTFTIFSPYLNKVNWENESDDNLHKSVHISDYIVHTEKDIIESKKNPEKYYLKFKPEFVIPDLIRFIKPFK